MSVKINLNRGNFSEVTFGPLTVWFSYSTPIAFQLGEDPIVIRENDWGMTTGHHLNAVNPNKSDRIPGEEFVGLLDNITIVAKKCDSSNQPS